MSIQRVQRHRRHTASLIGAAVVAAIAGDPARAQDTALQEVVVTTARQRAEVLLDVPATVDAFTAAEIQTAGIQRPQDFIALSPGLAQVQTAEIGDLQVNIRGINTGRDSETNFALVIDGVLQTSPTALNQELNAITQIEVLKGPQSALYGRNALAGAIILTTRKPTDETRIDLSAGIGSDSSYKANAWVGGSLSDSVKGSLSAYHRETDGQWDNHVIGCDDCVDYFEETGVQGRLLFDIGGGAYDLKAKYSKLEAGAINFNAALALADAAAGLGVPIFQENANDHVFTYLNNVKPVNEQENVNVSLKGEWSVGANTLTGYVAYNDQTNNFITDGTSAAFNLYSSVQSCIESNDARMADTPLPPPFFYAPSGTFVTSFLPPYGPVTCDGYQYQQRDQEDLSVELRLASPGDQRLRWIGGAYFADIDRRVVVSQGADNDAGFLAQVFVPTSGPNPTDLLYDDDLSSEVIAGFGQLAYDITDGLEVALAVRYDEERRKVSNNVPTGANAFAQTPGFGSAYSPTQPYINPAYTDNPALATTGIPDRSRTYSQFQPKLSVNWRVTEQWSAFASYGYGFRSGGFNSTGSAATISQAYGGLCLGPDFTLPVCDANSVFNITDVNDDYRKEVSKAAEVGLKAELFDRRLLLNGALFYTEVENMQYFNFFAGPFGLLRVVTNLDEVTLKGAEFDARWKVSDYFTLFAGIGYTDGEIDRYDGRPYTAGNEVPYAPEYTGNAGVEFTMPLGGNGLELHARADMSAVGETWFHPVQKNRVPNLFTGFGFGQGELSKLKRDPYEIFNARLTLQGDRWGVTAWGRNLSDVDYLAEVIPAPEFGGAFIHDAPGRSYGVEVNLRF
ncbi:MAG TPA: TonB-dependent receptor [Steroidobacteraceae bacterium]|nr:TonB-dependent receptor [Steroidobacteraceae bacterium]